MGSEMCIRDSSMTQSRGSFTMHFVRYEQCSADAQEKAVAAAKAMQEAE